jgi:hypothetical protein
MPFIGRGVRLCANTVQSTVMAARPRDVAEQHRRLDAARAVGLHPAVGGEGKALELFAEILDHVVALGLAMHQHVDADRLLAPHRMRDLALHGSR